MSEQGANLSLHGIDTNGALPRVDATREIEGRVKRDPDCERLKVIYPWRTQSERRKNVGCERGTRCQAARVPVRNLRVQLQPRRVVSGPGKQEWSRFDSPMIDMCLFWPRGSSLRWDCADRDSTTDLSQGRLVTLYGSLSNTPDR